LGGGLFAILTFIHFFVDWIFQSHSEAMVKHNNPKVRAKHCAIYTAGFTPLLLAFVWFGVLTPIQFIICVAILFISHFCEDTYLPVLWWAQYIRRPPQMTILRPTKIGVDEQGKDIIKQLPNPKIGFGEFVETAIGKILMITIDQIIHLAFLFPIVWMVMGQFDPRFISLNCPTYFGKSR
jgi:hypothetical protein